MVAAFVGIVIAIFMITIIILAIGGDRPSFSQAANVACRTHDGVRQIPDERTVAVCNDGTVVEVDY